MIAARLLAFPIWMLLTFALAGLAPGDARAEEDTWHAETLSSSPRGVHITQYWAKGKDKMRAETVVAGHRLITIVNGSTYYSVDVIDGKAIAVERNSLARKNDKRYPRLIGTEGFVIKDRGGEKVKVDRLAGQACDVWRLTDQRGQREVWVKQDDDGEMLPLRVEVYNRKAGVEVRTDYTQWASGLVLPDRMFKPDPRFELTEMSYEEFMKRSGAGERFPPPLHANLLHGER